MAVNLIKNFMNWKNLCDKKAIKRCRRGKMLKRYKRGKRKLLGKVNKI